MHQETQEARPKEGFISPKPKAESHISQKESAVAINDKQKWVEDFSYQWRNSPRWIELVISMITNVTKFERSIKCFWVPLI